MQYQIEKHTDGNGCSKYKVFTATSATSFAKWRHKGTYETLRDAEHRVNELNIEVTIIKEGEF